MTITTTSDEKLIRDLIDRWFAAINAADLDGVLRDHADDIVMFDVPPPNEGARGLDAYRETWPPFFAWLATGAVFEPLAVEVTAGTDVAFAHALLKCGRAGAPLTDPSVRLRITLGLRKEGERWVVSHEHHSFPLPVDDPAAAEQPLRP
ncbi:nuclear transport factor 2 family protein [Nocardia puris]|uniref:Uncharacterized protein (TIGR02246 family) n=1 Tax=Nocardia puris TaxID=208602 RepID=A0A366DRX6_9NOCA|nr:SgcJ/EcaC family oxidoreductase [Nocardia puris]RBO92857.1 uncharacterized protein (TIGR02246 family) [Nocardia puris]